MIFHRAVERTTVNVQNQEAIAHEGVSSLGRILRTQNHGICSDANVPAVARQDAVLLRTNIRSLWTKGHLELSCSLPDR